MPVLIPDRHKNIEIEGVLACQPETTRPPGSPRLRWFELEVYKLDSGGWLVHRNGRSLIYHRPDTPCRTRHEEQSGTPVDSIDELPDAAEPCPRCEPPWPEQLPDSGGGVRFEFDRHTFDKCLNRAQVVASLTRMKYTGGQTSGVVSDPVDKLLTKLLKADPEFAAQDKPVETYR